MEVVCCLIFMATFWIVAKTKYSEPLVGVTNGDEESHLIRDHFVGEISILINFMQVTSVLDRTFTSVKWPNNFQTYQSGMSFVNLDLSYSMPLASCSLSLSHRNKLILHMSTPLAIIVSILLSQWIAMALQPKLKCLAKSIPKSSKAAAMQRLAQKNVGERFIITIGGLLYPSLTSRVFSVFACYPVPGVGLLLSEDFGIECYTKGSEHSVYVTIGTVAIFIYVVGYPAYLIFNLWRAKDALYDQSHEKHILVRQRLGSLCKSHVSHAFQF